MSVPSEFKPTQTDAAKHYRHLLASGPWKLDHEEFRKRFIADYWYRDEFLWALAALMSSFGDFESAYRAIKNQNQLRVQAKKKGYKYEKCTMITIGDVRKVMELMKMRVRRQNRSLHPSDKSLKRRYGPT